MISQARSISSLRMNRRASPCDRVQQQPLVRLRDRRGRGTRRCSGTPGRAAAAARRPRRAPSSGSSGGCPRPAGCRSSAGCTAASRPAAAGTSGAAGSGTGSRPRCSRLLQPLAGAQVERHAAPAPVVDWPARRPRRSASRESGARPSRRGSRRTGPCTTCLRASSGGRTGMASSTLTFSLRSVSAAKRAGRLHRHQRQQLEQVVLEHVAQHAGWS